jgi:hypothetical protein
VQQQQEEMQLGDSEFAQVRQALADAGERPGGPRRLHQPVNRGLRCGWPQTAAMRASVTAGVAEPR